MRKKTAKIKVLYADLEDYDTIETIYINKDLFDSHKFLELIFNQLKDLIIKNHFGWDIKDKMLYLINNVIYWQNDKKFTDFTIEYVKIN